MQMENVFALFDSSWHLRRCFVMLQVRMQRRWRILQIRPACCAPRYETRRWLLRVMGTRLGTDRRPHPHTNAANFARSSSPRIVEKQSGWVLLHEISPSLGWIFLSASASASSSHLSTRRTLRGLLAARLTPLLPPQFFADPHRVQRISLLGLPRALKFSYRP